MATAPVVKTSLLNKLTNTVYLDYVLKIGGIIMLVLGFFKSWQHMTFVDKFLLISGPIAWYVGDKFNKIYK